MEVVTAAVATAVMAAMMTAAAMMATATATAAVAAMSTVMAAVASMVTVIAAMAIATAAVAAIATAMATAMAAVAAMVTAMTAATMAQQSTKRRQQWWQWRLQMRPRDPIKGDRGVLPPHKQNTVGRCRLLFRLGSQSHLVLSSYTQKKYTMPYLGIQAKTNNNSHFEACYSRAPLATLPIPTPPKYNQHRGDRPAILTAALPDPLRSKV
jgi:hypothetical protein